MAHDDVNRTIQRLHYDHMETRFTNRHAFPITFRKENLSFITYCLIWLQEFKSSFTKIAIMNVTSKRSAAVLGYLKTDKKVKQFVQYDYDQGGFRPVQKVRINLSNNSDF